jgi:hypothetical protein
MLMNLRDCILFYYYFIYVESTVKLLPFMYEFVEWLNVDESKGLYFIYIIISIKSSVKFTCVQA